MHCRKGELQTDRGGQQSFLLPKKTAGYSGLEAAAGGEEMMFVEGEEGDDMVMKHQFKKGIKSQLNFGKSIKSVKED